MTLKLTEDQATRFQSGGVLQLSLVGSGDNSSIQRTVNYGLLLNLTPRRQGEALSVDVQADLSSPVSINNPALLDVATRSVTSSVLLRPGVGQVVATFMSRRDEQNTSGLPGLSTSPAVGWLAGRSSSSAGSSLVVVTVELVEVL